MEQEQYSSSVAAGAAVVPGNLIGLSSRLRAGRGCYVRGGKVYSSVAGIVRFDAAPPTDEVAEGATASAAAATRATVERWGKRASVHSMVPCVGDVAVGRVTRITSNLVNVDILCLGERVRAATVPPSQHSHVRALSLTLTCPPTPAGFDVHTDGTVLPQPFSGVIRVEDVFPGEVDTSAIQMANCFRPKDMVKARIMSLGDTRQYFLSTADVHLGVIWTRDSTTGDYLVSHRSPPREIYIWIVRSLLP